MLSLVMKCSATRHASLPVMFIGLLLVACQGAGTTASTAGNESKPASTVAVRSAGPIVAGGMLFYPSGRWELDRREGGWTRIRDTQGSADFWSGTKPHKPGKSVLEYMEQDMKERLDRWSGAAAYNILSTNQGKLRLRNGVFARYFGHHIDIGGNNPRYVGFVYFPRGGGFPESGEPPKHEPSAWDSLFVNGMRDATTIAPETLKKIAAGLENFN